jgi:hypothetical protein
VKRRWQVLIALLPASILCAMSTLTLAYPDMESPLFFPAALVGTLGLGWAIIGAEAKYRWIVVTMLGVGVLTLAGRLVVPIIDSFGQPWVRKISPSEMIVGWLLPVWLVLGPLTFGVFYIVRLVRDGLRSPNTSLERTRDR